MTRWVSRICRSKHARLTSFVAVLHKPTNQQQQQQQPFIRITRALEKRERDP